MKRMILLFLLLLVTSCKTHKEMEIRKDTRTEWEGELLASSSPYIQMSYTLKELDIYNLSGHLRIWSKPDSLGNQYPVADMDFNKEGKKEKEEERNTEENDSILIHNKNRGVEEDQSVSKEIIKKDSRLISPETLWAICGLLSIVALMIWLIQRKR